MSAVDSTLMSYELISLEISMSNCIISAISATASFAFAFKTTYGCKEETVIGSSIVLILIGL